MKNILMLASSLVLLGACSQLPASAPYKASELCQSPAPCTVKGQSAEAFFSKFEAKTIGSCADPANMAFNHLAAESVQARTGEAGFAMIRVDLNPDGTYKAFYVEPTGGAFGPTNPDFKTERQVTKTDGKWHLGDDKIVIEGIGMGHATTDDEILVLPLNTTPFNIAGPKLISFSARTSRMNADGKTVEQVCAEQAAAAPAH